MCQNGYVSITVPQLDAPDSVPDIADSLADNGVSPPDNGVPLPGAPLSAVEAADLAELMKALADPVRLRLLSLIAAQPTGEACVCDLSGEFELSQPTISHHLKKLKDAGLIDGDRRGTWVYYRIVPSALRRMSAILDAARLQTVKNS